MSLKRWQLIVSTLSLDCIDIPSFVEECPNIVIPTHIISYVDIDAKQTFYRLMCFSFNLAICDSS